MPAGMNNVRTGRDFGPHRKPARCDDQDRWGTVMTSEEKEALMVFVLRQANLTVLDRVLGDAIFERVDQGNLTKNDINYLLWLARQEEIDVRASLQGTPGPRLSQKINRFLNNIETVKKLLH